MAKVFSVFAQNLGAYSEGNIVGDWIDLPQKKEVIDRFLKEKVKIYNDNQEYEIADTEDFPFEYKIIQYAEKKKEKIEGMIATFDKMNDDYIFLADLDEKREEIRRKEIMKKFKNINCEKIYFSIQEIESWYIAAISDNNKNKYKEISEKLHCLVQFLLFLSL